MTNTVKVRLRWLSDNFPDQAQRVCRPARFEHQSDDWLNDAWSVVVQVTGSPDAEGYQEGQARFLSPDAPYDWLSKGRKFTLLEGELALAFVEVQDLTIG